MTKPFVQIGDNLNAEAWNGSILFMEAFNPIITIDLPDDIDDNGEFVEGTVDSEGNPIYTKAGMMPLYLTLVDTVITSNGLGIELGSNKTSGTATFRIYPNFEPFKTWNNLRYTYTTGDGTVTCKVYKNFGNTLVDSNYTSMEDLSSKGLVLEYIDFVFTLTKTSSTPQLGWMELVVTGGS